VIGLRKKEKCIAVERLSNGTRKERNPSTILQLHEKDDKNARPSKTSRYAAVQKHDKNFIASMPGEKN